MTETELVSLLSETGPLTGAQLMERTGLEVLSLWQACSRASAIRFQRAGRRFLRLDRSVQGYARLSPSIRREFLTYTYVGLDSQADILADRANALRAETERISRAKQETARQAVEAVISMLPGKDVLLQKACFMIAGEVVYGMSHMVPRPEKSTGEMVQGSDLDIIVIVTDDLAPELIDSLDRAMHKRKHRLLVNEREEIDYLIKTVARVEEQLKFDIFSSMVACKILDEGRFLYGSAPLFQEIKDLILRRGIKERLEELERQATASRESAETQLLQAGEDADRAEYLSLFYTHAKEDEIY